VRARDADDHRGERDEQDGEWQVASRSGRAVDDVRQEGRVPEARREGRPAPLARDVEPHEQGHGEEAEEREWPVEPHR
jgi:hypothetical protein